jgi:putative transcriptional regulator
MSSVNLTDHFLIAMPAMVDRYFAKTLTYVCEHNDRGALGIVVNRPIDVSLAGLMEQVSIPVTASGLDAVALHFGGPVQVDRGFVLHRPLGSWGSTLEVTADIGLTTSKDVLEAIARGEGPAECLVSLGYAGWAPGQLEHELAQNAWLTVAATPAIIFKLPAEQRLAAAMKRLGVDYATLGEAAGHA